MPFDLKNKTLIEPPRLGLIPESSQWLAGEGAGSWFHVSALNSAFIITRYSPQGKIECSGMFEIVNGIGFDIHTIYQFTHLSHCKSVNIIQNNKVIKMVKILSS